MPKKTTFIPKSAVGYTRVSDKLQLDGISLENQAQSIREYCRQKNLHLDKIYEDKAKSGRYMEDREQLNQLLRDLKQGTVVIIYAIARLFRSMKDGYTLKSDIEAAQCKLVSITENYDFDTCDGEFMFGLSGLLAQQESMRISQRVSACMLRLSQNGTYNGIDFNYQKDKLKLKPIYGFNSAGKKLGFIPNLEELAVVKIILELRNKNYSPYKITQYLNNRNILNRKGRPWTHPSINCIIKNFNNVDINLIIQDYYTQKNLEVP